MIHYLPLPLLHTLPLREPKGKNCGFLIQVQYPEVNVQKTFSIWFLQLSRRKAFVKRKFWFSRHFFQVACCFSGPKGEHFIEV